jgi:TolB-like protein/cytochrome c-type biogenesis protein CcmH/NrfG
VISAIGIGYWYLSGSSKINSIAVMPFVNESGNEDIEYLSDGMTETLISSLTKIPNLSVMARSSVFYYKGKNTTPRQIGEELNVEAILLGRVTQRGEDLKISLELVDTKTLAAIWSETYDRKMSDLVTLQSEIARNVSDKLRLKLTASEQEKAARSGTANSEAQQLYLKALFHFNKRTHGNGGQEMEKGVDFFKQAIKKDPNYALAFAGLAASYSLMPWYVDYDPRESLPKAKEAAQKALELDPDLAEAHAVLGNILSYSYDWEGGERSYLKAIELDPKYANAHGWYADYFASKGLYDEALREYDKALEIDPLDHVAGFDKVRTLIFAERYDEAVSLAKKLIELFPENALGPYYLARTYLEKGMEKEAMEQEWISMEKFGYQEAMIQEFKDIYEERGLDGLYRKQIETRLARVKTKLEKDKNAFVRYAPIYQIYAKLKDKEKTLEYMNKAYQQREMDMINLKRGRDYDFLKDEPEFQELLKKIGYPE